MKNNAKLLKLKSIFMSKKKHKIVVTTHKNPDGDALGSSLALSRFLKKLDITSILLYLMLSLHFTNGCQVSMIATYLIMTMSYVIL